MNKGETTVTIRKESESEMCATGGAPAELRLRATPPPALTTVADCSLNMGLTA